MGGIIHYLTPYLQDAVLGYRQGRWRLAANGPDFAVQLEQCALWPGVVVLNFCRDGCRQRLAVLLFVDSCDLGQQRQLRVLLRHSNSL